MPTKEFTPLLDRTGALRSAQPLIELVCPLLREIVNKATWVFHECNSEGSRVGGENEDVAAMTLYRHMIEGVLSASARSVRAAVGRTAIPAPRAPPTDLGRSTAARRPD